MPPKAKQNLANQYSAKDIKLLTPREHVRLRPGMYIGGTDSRALHHMVYEVLDNATEEVMIGKCNRITITLRTNHTVTVEDNSEGLPIEEIYHPRYDIILTNGEVAKKSYLEFIMTESVHKPRFEGQHYGIHGGLHGLGLTIVNCLSKSCTVQVRRDGCLWEQSYEEGLPITQVQCLRELHPDESTGNTITFQPDFTILDENEFDFQTVTARCEDIAHLFPAVTISVRDLREDYLVEAIYHAPNGFTDWMNELNETSKPIHPPMEAFHTDLFQYRNDNDYRIGVTLAFQFTEMPQTIEKSFVNSVPISDGGVHVTAMKSAILKVINAKLQTSYKWHDLQTGFASIIHIQHPSPQFESPTKTKLMSPEVGIVVETAVQQAFDTQPEAFEMLIRYLAAK